MFVVIQQVRGLWGRLGALWPRRTQEDVDEFDGIEAAAGGFGF